MVIGPPDAGKSTFARYLFRKLNSVWPRVAFLDGDPGQSILGPPTTMTLGLSGDSEDFPPQGKSRRRFVGAVSPVGHMLPVLTAAARLIEEAQRWQANAIVFDTTGLIDPNQGGVYLKLAKIDLLRPSVLFAIQKEDELEMLLQPLRRSKRTRVIELPVSDSAAPRSLPARQAHRAEKFAEYFRNSRFPEIQWERFAVFPNSDFTAGQLLALEDIYGFTLALGIVEEVRAKSREVITYTPLSSLEKVDALRLGSIRVDRQTFHDRRL